MKSLPTSFAVEVSEDLSQEAIHTFPPIKSSQNGKVASSTNTEKTIQFGAASSTSTLKDEYNYATESTLIVPNAPVDLSTNKQMHNPASTMKGLENFDLFGLGSSTGQSFADLASGNSGDFAFGSTEEMVKSIQEILFKEKIYRKHKVDKHFAWQNAGSAVFSSLASAKRGDHEGDCGDEVEQNDDIHFEPIVSLPEVEVKSGEEDEQVLFKERAKMYRWDRTAAQWKERGVGEIKILFHPEKKSYRVLMRRDKIHKVCANHSITKSMDIQPLTTSNNALVWTAMDYADDQATLEQLAVRFQTPELANTFKMKFQECQQKLPDETKDA